MFEQTKQFLETLFEPDDIIELRLINTKTNEVEGRWWSLKEVINSFEYLKIRNKEKQLNIYFGVNPRIKKNERGDKNVKLCRNLFVDFDDISPENFNVEYIQAKIAQADLPAPTYILNSGHGFHCYWRLTKMVLPNEWKQIQERLNEALDSDRTIKNPERILRLPGFLNVKREPFIPCKIEKYNKEAKYNIEDIEKALSGVEVKQKPDYSTEDVEGRPTWIEEELKRQELITGRINSIGEVMVKSCDPALTSARTSMNIFTGRWFNFSHDAHPELKSNGLREGYAIKYFAMISEGAYTKAAKEKIRNELLDRYEERFVQWYKSYIKKAMTEKEPSEKYISYLREQIKNGQVTKLVLSSRNPTKTWDWLRRIFYPNELIHRNDFEIYGAKDNKGNTFKFYKIADRRLLIENIYTLFKYSIRKVTIGKGQDKIEIDVPNDDVEPKDVDKVLKRGESMKGIYYSPEKYLIPFRKDKKIITPPLWIPYKDYDTNWQTGEELPASAITVLHARLPYNRNKDAKLSELAVYYLKSVFDDMTIKLIRNVMKLFITQSRDQQFLTYILGKKGRGKGVLFYIFVEVLGRYNFIELSPHTLEKDDALNDAEGKLLAGKGDVRWGKFYNPYLVLEQMLALINREPVKIKQLYKNRYDAILDLCLLWCGEKLPSGLPDVGTHLNDKMIVIPVADFAPNWRLLLDRKDEYLKYKLTTPEELEGWCEWALGGDSISIIDNTEEGKRKIEQMSKILDPVYNFAQNCIDFDLKYVMGMRIKDARQYKYQESVSDLFRCFVEFHKRKGLEWKKGETVFNRDFESSVDNKARYQQLKYSETERPWRWVGCKINSYGHTLLESEM